MADEASVYPAARALRALRLLELLSRSRVSWPAYLGRASSPRRGTRARTGEGEGEGDGGRERAGVRENRKGVDGRPQGVICVIYTSREHRRVYNRP